MAVRGELGWYNESEQTGDGWTPARVLMTESDPTADQIDAMAAQSGSYAGQPQPGWVYIQYEAMAGQVGGSPAYTYAEIGTGPNNYSTTRP